MFPVPWTVAIIFLLAYACVGLLIGAAVGLAIQLVSKMKVSSVFILISGAMGVCGFVAGCIATFFTAWPITTESHMEGATTITSTIRGYQHPERIGYLFAFLISLAWALFRIRRDRSRQTLPDR